MILTLSQPQDLHAFAVREGLRRKGSDTVLWLTTELAQRQRASVEIDRQRDATWSVVGKDLGVDPEKVEVVWLRRPELPVVTDALHPADREFAAREYEEFFRWTCELLPGEAFWVNALTTARRARSKIEQQRVALRVGLAVPRTLYTNDPRKIRSFLRRQGGRIAYKPFRQQGPWVLGDRGYAHLFTSVLTEEVLPDDEVLRATPGIYQEYVEKFYELRITVIGRYVFAAKIDSQKTSEGRVDWRQALTEVHCEKAEIPARLERAILKLMDEMGLVFGCFDFIVTREGGFVFLEVNEMGQFLFVEADTGIPLLDAFCEMLLQRRADFRWEERGALDYRDMEREVFAMKERAQEEHVVPHDRVAGTESAEDRPDPLAPVGAASDF